MSRRFRLRAARLMTALGVAAAACGCAGPPSHGTVTIVVHWAGAELQAFTIITKKFTEQSGITVNIEPTRGEDDELAVDLQQHEPPNLADLPSIGAVRAYYSAGDLSPLSDLASEKAYGPLWQGLTRIGPQRQPYAAPVKIDLKSLVWYNQSKLSRSHYAAPTTGTSWKQLVGLSQAIQNAGHPPWCLALASVPVSGWPGADWIADVLLSTYGPTVYQAWVSGTLSWKSSEVTQAWTMWSQLMGASAGSDLGVPESALTTRVGNGRDSGPGSGPSPHSPCYLGHGALADFPDGTQSGYDFVPVPSPSGALQVSADFLVMLKKAATPQAKKLISYLTEKSTQKSWMSQPDAGGFSANEQVPLTAYPAGVRRRIARLITTARELCFGAADAMAPELSAAFDHEVLRYLAEPTTLRSTILPALDTVARHNRADAPDVCVPRSTAGSGP
jgi:alpha-glucoside transport system substrate-binding protein